MEDAGDPHLKRERPGPYGHPPPPGLHHLPPADSAALHNYHHPPHPGAAMPPNWNPTPSPYEGGEHRPPGDAPPHQQPYPSQHYPPPHPGHVSDPAYSRQGSNSAPTRSPQNSQQPSYPAPPVNGTGHEHQYYQQPPPDYRDRPPYGPPPGPPNGAQPPHLHVTTNHEMMPGQPQSAPPLSYPPSAGPPGAPYNWGVPGYGDYGQRRKPVRAAQACDPCRQRKAKCDEGRPTCTHCKDNGLTCTYRDIPPQKSEKQVLAINDKLESLSDDVKSIMAGWKAQEEKINKLLSIQESQAAQLTSMVSKVPEDQKVSFREDPKTYKLSQQLKQEPRSELLNHNFNPSSSTPTAAGATADTPQETAARPKNFPAAANLLSWPSIKVLIPKDQTESYVMDTESERGLLRLFGCGEGEDRGDGHDGAPSPTTSTSSGRHDDDASSGTPQGVWGTGQFPPAGPGSFRNNEHPGGLGFNGGLQLDSAAVDKYYVSYLDNMHKLHPFLDTKVLRRMVTTFKKKYSYDFRYNHSERAISSIGAKRKRETSGSPASMGDCSPPQAARVSARRDLTQLAPIEHSVANAIILLVLALGKICAHRDPLPGPVMTSSIKVSTPHNIYTDLPMSLSASAPPSPYSTQTPMNGAGLTTSAGNPQGKNMDFIPGLAYFTKAADILGEMPGGVDVSHVQANLLAGLYMGQLARILPSHWYIRNACTACQILIQSTPYKERKISAVRRNLINFAFWSCLQLESDILAEMEIPASGIVSKEASMFSETPTQLTLADPDRGVDDSRVVEEHRHYLYQIQLRRTINDSLKYLYNEDRAQNKPAETVVGILASNLEEWRNVLGDWNWDDDDHQSDEVNVARMRAKYYGAKYIIHRPALYWALHFTSGPSTPMSRPSDSPVGQGYGSEFSSPTVAHSFGSHQAPPTSRRVSDMRPPPMRSVEPLEKWIIDASKRCIHAAVRSTTAFDKVPPRVIITNIFGTAHAQFGNMLVLSATYASQHHELNSLVDVTTLRYLMDRTIRFLQRHEQISPTLGADARILQHVQKELRLQCTAPTSATSSFSSR